MRQKGSCNVVFMDNSDKCFIRNIIQDFSTYGKKVPTILKLLLTIKRIYISLGEGCHCIGL